MVKKIVAGVVLVLIIVFGAVDDMNTTNSFNQLIEQINQVEELLQSDQTQEAQKVASDTLAWWKKKRDILELTCPHDEVKDLAAMIAELRSTINQNDIESAITMCETISTDAESRRDLITLKLKNIL